MHKSALILFNISKTKNFGSLIRTADVFGVSELLLVGRKKFLNHGNFNSYDSRKLQHFYRLNDAIVYLRECDYSIFGIEICDQAQSIEQQPFDGNTAFLPGNEGTGLSVQQKAYCDKFVYIKQFGTAASLNVNVATGIVLHHFSVWANFKSKIVREQKFVSS